MDKVLLKHFRQAERFHADERIVGAGYFGKDHPTQFRQKDLEHTLERRKVKNFSHMLKKDLKMFYSKHELKKIMTLSCGFQLLEIINKMYPLEDQRHFARIWRKDISKIVGRLGQSTRSAGKFRIACVVAHRPVIKSLLETK